MPGPFAVILPAAGRSTRFGDPLRKKTYADLAGRAVWRRSAEAFCSRADVGQVILAIAPEDREGFFARFGGAVGLLGITVIDGGAERHETIARALAAVDPLCEFVAVHDAARPCVPASLIDRVFAAARECGAAIPGLPVADTLKRVDPSGRVVVETVSRAGLVAVQTPQAFRRDLLEAAYAARDRVEGGVTDDARLVEALGHEVRVVEGSAMNLKITLGPDLAIAEAFLLATGPPRDDRPARRPFDDDEDEGPSR